MASPEAATATNQLSDAREGTARFLTSGTNHSCAIQAQTDRVVCWGRDREGQVSSPVSLAAREIAAGFQHSCAIGQNSAALVCWGADGFGESSPP